MYETLWAIGKILLIVLVGVPVIGFAGMLILSLILHLLERDVKNKKHGGDDLWL